MIYYTHDFDGSKIRENAIIHGIESPSLPEALEKLENRHGMPCVLLPGTFGDCWLKVPAGKNFTPWPLLEQEVIRVPSGEHPGMQGYEWIVPIAEVFCLEFGPGVALPTVHPNGTAAASLIEAHCSALEPLREALSRLAEVSPHGRDYPQGNAYFEAARRNHTRRRALLESLISDLENDAIMIDDSN